MNYFKPNQKLNILIVDDEPVVRESLKTFLVKNDHQVDEVDDASAALEVLRMKEFDIVLLDIRMPGMSGLSLLVKIRAFHPDLAVIMITGHGTIDTAIEALRKGAVDFLKKPLKMNDLLAALARATQLLDLSRSETRLKGVLRAIQKPDFTIGKDLIGESDSIRKVRKNISLAAAAKYPTILICGETGTGKEIVARSLHLAANSDSAPFIPVNCPAMPETLVESELFGHMKGAFTGAVNDRLGAFELAHDGTLFLDEIADLDLSAQVKLLRVLETRLVRRIGGAKERDVNVMVVAATNQDLMEMTSNKSFRLDLLYRLNAFQIDIAPLRERPEDIVPLAEYFIKRFYNERVLKGMHTVPSLSSAVQKKLMDYDYPGNARELKNIIEKALILSGLGPIDLDQIVFSSKRISPLTINPDPVSDSMCELAKETLKVLREVKWNRTKAAKKLSISYDALRWRINKYKLLQH